VPISAALRQGPHIKVATVASCWQCVGYLIGSRFEPHTSRTRSERLITCAIWPVQTKNFITYLTNRHNSILGYKLRTDAEQLRLKILKKLRTGSLNSEFTGSYKK